MSGVDKLSDRDGNSRVIGKVGNFAGVSVKRTLSFVHLLQLNAFDGSAEGRGKERHRRIALTALASSVRGRYRLRLCRYR